jgi:hypothetical protein
VGGPEKCYIVRMRNLPIVQRRTLMLTHVCCAMLFFCCLLLLLRYNSRSVIKHHPISLHQIRTSTTLSGLLVTQHVFQGRVRHRSLLNVADCKKKSLCVLGTGVAQSMYCLTTDWTTGVRSLAEAKDFFSPASVSRPTLRLQPPVQWVLGVLSQG